MLSFGNKDFRNLQEQVLKNMSDIQDMMQGVTVLADFGIKVVGQVESAADLPDPSEYEGDYGDAYVVGESEPYDYYIFTRAFEGEEEPQWFNLGQFPVPGPQGETGPQGEIGETPNVSMEIGTVSTLMPTQSATASIVKSGTLENPVFTLNLAIPKGFMGMMGLTGPQGPRGPQGPQGEQGPRGEQGGLIEIVGIVETASQLPSPSTLQKLDAAYLVGSSPDYELYVQVGDAPSTALWTNLGAINEGTVVTVNGTPQTVWEASGQFVPIYDGQLVDTLYGQAAGTGNGQTHVPYGTSATANAIPQRDVNGQIIVPENPTLNGHAASKAYVDAHASSSPIEYQGDIIVGNSSGEESRLAIGSAGQVLTVNSSGNGLEYSTITGVPSYLSSDAGNALKVNSAGTGLEWGSAGGGLISVPSASYTAGYSLGDTAISFTNGDYYCQKGQSLLINNSGRTSFTWSTSNFGSIASAGSCYYKNSIYFGDALNNSSGYVYSSSNSLIGTQVGTSHNYGYNVHSILMGAVGRINSGLSSQYSFLNGYQFSYSGSPSYPITFKGCIITSASTYHDLGSITNTNYIHTGCLIVGDGHLLAGTNHREYINIIGRYGKIIDSTRPAIFTVGCGASTSSRANCFSTGNDGTDDYIYIGDTKLTETQLQALIALLS